MITSFIGHAYFDLIIKALQSQSHVDDAEQRLIGNCRQHGLVFHGYTPADGNCFFHAVSDQLSLLGVPGQSSSQLRNKVVQFLKSNPTVEVSTVVICVMIKGNDQMRKIFFTFVLRFYAVFINDIVT